MAAAAAAAAYVNAGCVGLSVLTVGLITAKCHVWLDLVADLWSCLQLISALSGLLCQFGLTMERQRRGAALLA